MNKNSFWTSRVKESSAFNPVDWIAEVLFGLIMVLSIAGTLSVSNTDKQEVRELLWAALGCNVAWSLVDAIMYLMNIVVERGHALQLIFKIRDSKYDENSNEVLKGEIQPLIAALLTQQEFTNLCERIKQLRAPTKKNLVTFSDIIAGGQIFLLVFLCSLPVALPFAFMKDVGVARRALNAVALVLLFIGGYILAKYANFRPFLTALVYCLIGVLLVGLTMPLEG
ncbi:MAG: hypothetical protein PSX36_02725 [bacterium]|nr:hypothetical protein [bacterium]